MTFRESLLAPARHCLALSAVLFLGLSPQTSKADVLISEFLADNQDGLRTKSGQAADWIELVNTGSQSVDLGGWYLTDNADTPMKWRVPDGTIIAAGAYQLIFADSSDISVTNSELHANFGLSKDGEFLGLVRPDGSTFADQYTFGPQFKDVSYGRGAPPDQPVISPDAGSRYRVPNASGTAPWNFANGALGFSGTNGAFTVRYYEMSSAINSVDQAEAMVADSGYWMTDKTYPIVGQYDTIDFHGTSGSGSFTVNRLFPGHSYAGEDRDRFVIVAEGAINVPSAGLWTFAVGSDDGFRLRISGHGAEFVSEYPSPRGFDQTLATFNFPVPGIYNLYLIFYENGGGASVEFSVAQDFQAFLSPDVFHLTGDPAGGMMHAGAIGSLVDTDVSATMKNVNARLDAEWTFTLAQAPAPDDLYTLSVRCADGFAATVNGTAIAALNAPSPLEWNSAATTTRPVEAAMQWLSYPVPASALRAGENTLSIAALNNAASDTDFLLEARLGWRSAPSFSAFFKNPTPGAANAQAYTEPTPIVAASQPRGYRTTPFTVSLTSTNPSAQIRYTLDGSTPGANSPLYTAPLNVSRTTTLRAAVVDPDTIFQNVTTVSWLFLGDILQQGSTPPSGWPANRQVNNHVMEYGLRPEIVTGDGTRLRNGMTNAIPSLSIVTDLDNLFSAQKGIYVNPGNDGIAWERPVSVELIDPVNGSGSEFQIDAGLRIRGAFSRSSSNPKHSFRLLFRSDYGQGKLRFPLFGSEGASEYDKVDLRTSQNYSWAYENGTRDTFVRETFSRDAQRELGMPYTRSRYYHLYLNGQYWGLYQTQERGDADFAETYLGGNSDDWDCIKTSQPGYTTTASDGNFDAFYALHNLALNQGFAGAFANNYYRVRGLNPDGTRNPAYPVLLDADNLIIYMLVAYYTGDPDSPVSIWGGMPNNMYALYNRLEPDGFKWLRHDAEHSLGAHGSYGVTCDTTTAGSSMTSQYNFNPAILHQRLCQHPEYRRRFADLVQKHLYGDGALTPPKAVQLFQSRMSEIDLAIIGESARWGRGKTRDATWIPACNEVLNTYLPQRRDIIIGHFRARGWFPNVDAPNYSVMNSEVAPGQVIRLAGSGTFYYTTNGTDPRLPNGALNPAAVAVNSGNGGSGPQTLVARGADWRYFDLGSEPAPSGKLTWRDPGYSDNSWGHGPAIIGFAGGGSPNPVATTTRRYVNGVSAPQVTTTYLRHTFNLDSTNNIPSLVAELLRDDGVVIYLNGVEVAEWRHNMSPGTTTYDTFSASVVGAPDQNTYFTLPADAQHLLRVGANTLAVEVHQSNSGSSDLYFDFSLTIPGTTAQVFADLPVNHDLLLMARAFNGSEWSALSENALRVQRPPMDYSKLRVSELMHAPPAPAGTNYNDDDFAWIEFRNTGAAPLDLEGVNFTSGITHTFAPYLLAPGARVVLAKNVAAFATRYDTNGIDVLQWANGNLSRRGETLSITDPATNNILTFAYSNLWYPQSTDDSSLVAVDLAAEESLWSTAENWRPSAVSLGTPGRAEGMAFSNARVTAQGLLVDVSGLEGSVELWVSDDLNTWSQCDAGAWSRTASGLSIDLQHPSLAGRARCFFQLRLAD